MLPQKADHHAVCAAARPASENACATATAASASPSEAVLFSVLRWLLATASSSACWPPLASSEKVDHAAVTVPSEKFCVAKEREALAPHGAGAWPVAGALSLQRSLESGVTSIASGCAPLPSAMSASTPVAPRGSAAFTKSEKARAPPPTSDAFTRRRAVSSSSRMSTRRKAAPLAGRSVTYAVGARWWHAHTSVRETSTRSAEVAFVDASATTDVTMAPSRPLPRYALWNQRTGASASPRVASQL